MDRTHLCSHCYFALLFPTETQGGSSQLSMALRVKPGTCVCAHMRARLCVSITVWFWCTSLLCICATRIRFSSSVVSKRADVCVEEDMHNVCVCICVCVCVCAHYTCRSQGRPAVATRRWRASPKGHTQYSISLSP